MYVDRKQETGWLFVKLWFHNMVGSINQQMHPVLPLINKTLKKSEEKKKALPWKEMVGQRKNKLVPM